MLLDAVSRRAPSWLFSIAAFGVSIFSVGEELSMSGERCSKGEPNSASSAIKFFSRRSQREIYHRLMDGTEPLRNKLATQERNVGRRA